MATEREGAIGMDEGRDSGCMDKVRSGGGGGGNERAFRKTSQGGYKVRLGTWVGAGGGSFALYEMM
jgi:hypothetical protein